MQRHSFLTAVVFAFASLGLSAWAAVPKKQATKLDPALPAVEKVLRAEVAGQVDRRGQLAETLKDQPDSAPARWQAGFVKDSGSWQPVDIQPAEMKKNELLDQYRARRNESPRTFRGQLDLANWCKKQGLNDQERAHLIGALLLDPAGDQSAILRRLGRLQLGNQLVTEKQLIEWRNMNRHTMNVVKTWGPKLEKIAEKLGGLPRQYEMGLANLNELVSPDSIPAIEYTLSGRDEVCALAAVDAFKKSETYEGTLALAKQASFSKWPTVRERATAALKARRFEDFVPALIGLLATPTSSTFATTGFCWFLDRPYLKNDGGTVFFVMTSAFILARETDNQFEIAVLHTVDHRLNDLFKGFRISLDHGLQFSRPVAADLLLTRNATDLDRSNAEESYKNERVVDSINERTEQLNRQLVSVLAGVTGRDPSPDPATWWQWWSDFSDTQQSYAKPVVTVLEEQTEDRGDPTRGVPRLSCFAAGTVVWTESGGQSIESIQVGDRVLSKDVDTGALTYKPVLQTTVRPPKDLTTLRFGNETIVCTGGHRFWVSGQGWTKARDLTEQTLLHTVTGNMPVWTAKKGEVAETYNLVVADFHTYFVGQTGVLCQDLLPPQRTDNIVPGLSRTNAAAQAKK